MDGREAEKVQVQLTGQTFRDNTSGQTLMLVTAGQFKGCLMAGQPDGSWTPIRQATGEQVKAIYEAVRDSYGGRSPGRKTAVQAAGVPAGAAEMAHGSERPI